MVVKFVVISGGVVSGLGKGISASSIGLLLKESGLHITCIKIDPYLNIDAGTMSPYEHGEVFVLDDGGEVDLDLGNYERFMDISLTRDNNITTGKIYDLVLRQERKGSYLGKTVQLVPHITDTIQDWISRVSHIPVDESNRKPDICLIELGGTIGDIESMVFLEALRQLEFRVGRDNFCHIHIALVPEIGFDNTQKSKPAQHSARELRTAGLLPNMIICRSKHEITREIQEKVSIFSMVPVSHVFSLPDVKNIYEVPSMLLKQNVPAHILSILRIHKMTPVSLPIWDSIAEQENKDLSIVRIGIVGKYTGSSDTYISVIKALHSAARCSGRKAEIIWIDSENLEMNKNIETEEFKSAKYDLEHVDGILVPGGFGNRGIEGKIFAAKYARENNIPFLGICLGMQVAIIEFARNVLRLNGAHSSEFDAATKYPVVIFMPEISPTEMGGNMRLGKRIAKLKSNSLAHKLYGTLEISERHRHRYEINPKFVPQFENSGLVFSGEDDLGTRMEIIEIPEHVFYFGTQFHPEFKSKPFIPSPPFFGFVKASAKIDLDNEMNENIGLKLKKEENGLLYHTNSVDSYCEKSRVFSDDVVYESSSNGSGIREQSLVV